MTTEQKAKAYEMALEGARKELGVDRKEWEVVQQVLHNIFPGLAESEDERIRKALIHFLKHYHTGNGEYISFDTDWIAWLEKQKEQKPNKDTGFPSVTKFVYNKGDEEFIRDCANILKGNDYGVSAERLLSMLEQNPAEWSEEDENMAYFINQFLEYHEASDPTAKSCKDWFKNKLKSLRPSWKPSEEQMHYLHKAVVEAKQKEAISTSGYTPACVLESLYEQLKKL